jgi:hypothetical protein
MTKTLNRKANQMTGYHYLSPTEVQFFLDNIGGQPFKVIFTKKDMSQRQVIGVLDVSNTEHKQNVPVMTDEGWKCFNIGRVLWIGNHEEEGLVERIYAHLAEFNNKVKS